MLDVTVAPGAVEPVHHHRWPSVLHITAMGDFIDRSADGEVLLDTRRLDAPLPLPFTMWKEPEAPHTVENLSRTQPIRLVRVELKTGGLDPAAAAPPSAPVYVVADITVHDPATYARYRDAVAPVIAAHGGRYLVRSGAARFDGDTDAGVVSPEGAWTPDRIIVLEFPSQAALDGYVASAAYRAAAPLRAASATTRSLVVNGYAPED